MLRTYGRQSARSAGATIVLALAGLTTGLIPLALLAVFAPDQPPGDLAFIACAILAGGTVGWLTRRN